MEPQNFLGLYISKTTATAVCLGLQGQSYKTIDCFSISDQEKEGQNLQMLATLAAQACIDRRLEFSEVAVALDSAMFMQHNVHSDFTDPKQISATVRFDTEEAFATDIADVAIAFKITSSDQTGSDLTVFTAQRKILSDILLSLQSNNIDPVTIEPDVSCLSRFICRNVSFPEGLRPLFGMLSHHSGYLIIPPSSIAGPGSQKTPIVRTFLVGPTQYRSELLARETLVTTALLETGEPINCLKVFDSAGSVDYQQVTNKLDIEVGELDLVGSAAIDPQSLADCDDPVDFAIAYGAALAHLEKTQTINFRNDFMPYQGKKLRLQKALKFASYSITILMVAIGLYFQVSLWKANRSRSAARRKFAEDYSAVMLGEQLPKKARPITELKSELTQLRKVKSGQLSIRGEKSISSKLILVLQAINSCAKQTSLNVESISITHRNINIVGSTSSKTNTLKFFDAIGKNEMEVQQQSLYTKNRRDHFSITIVPKSS